MWIALQKYHEKSTLSNKVNLLKKICGLRLTENGNMETLLAQMEGLLNQLSNLGKTLAEHLIMAFFLSNLPGSYGTLITALKTRPETDLTQEPVKNKLIAEYNRRSQIEKVSETQDHAALKAIEETKKFDTARKGTEFTCYFCKEPNHIKRDCKKYIERKKRQTGHKARTVRERQEARIDREMKVRTPTCVLL